MTVMAMPTVAAMPAPVAMVPTVMPAAVPVAMVVAMPAHFFRLDAIDVVLRDDGGLSGRARGRQRLWRDRRQRCSLRGCGKRRTGCNKTKGEFQEVPTFHEVRPFPDMIEKGKHPSLQMNGR